MRDFASCFGENGVQLSDTSCSTLKPSQNSVTCVYRCKLLSKSCLINVIWSRNLMGQCLSIEIQDSSHRSVLNVKPSLFSKRKGSKCLLVNSTRVEIFWDLCEAKFGSGPEPLEDYYIAIVSKQEMVLLIGNLRKEAFSKTGAVSLLPNTQFISKRQHISGKNVYTTKAQFCENGEIHDLRIECTSEDQILVIKIDAKIVIEIRNLQWKFRGNCTIKIDGVVVEVFWDLYNWLFGCSLGNAVFLFYTSFSAGNKMWISSSHDLSSQSHSEGKFSGLGFSLVVYAWKTE